MNWYRITLDGFCVYNQTWDNIFQTDGKGDEVFFTLSAGFVDTNGNSLLSSETVTRTMGDRRGFPERVQAGSSSSMGGLVSGNWFPQARPWERTDFQEDHPPMVLFEGPITDTMGAVIMPVIWEWDGDPDLFNEWGGALADNWKQIAAGLAAIILAISTAAGTPAIGIADIVKSTGDFLPALFRMTQSIVGVAKNRPIGMVTKDNGYEFKPKILVLTEKTAEAALKTSFFGRPAGVIEITYSDASELRGKYGVFLKLEKIAAPGDGTMLRAPSSDEVFVIYGGAKFATRSPELLSGPGDQRRVLVVPDEAIEKLPSVPRDGTVLRELSSSSVYVIKNGQKCRIPNEEILTKHGGRGALHVVPDGGLARLGQGPELS